MTISEHSESESSSLHSSEGGQSSLLGATNSSGQGPKSFPNVPMFFLRNKHPSKFVGLRLRLKLHILHNVVTCIYTQYSTQYYLSRYSALYLNNALFLTFFSAKISRPRPRSKFALLGLGLGLGQKEESSVVLGLGFN